MHRGATNAHGRGSPAAVRLMQQLQQVLHAPAAAGIAQAASRARTFHHMSSRKTLGASWSAWARSARTTAHSGAHVRRWQSYAVASYTPKLPAWVRSRLPEMPEGKRSPQPAVLANPLLLCSHTVWQSPLTSEPDVDETWPGWTSRISGELHTKRP